MSKEREVARSEGAINARKRSAGSREDLEDYGGTGPSNSRRSNIGPVSTSSFTSATGTFAANSRSGSSMQAHQQLVGNAGTSSGAAAIVTPCAACKLLRRRCAQECPFAPYFSPHEPHKFACVHKIYGASNVSKMLMMRLEK
ncbi:hypothetical protein GOP47_0001480 [Adiantum capillus-veneris]|uniref:LOB domain-containing protein n=1 Tax=Adiantum capillus-veneris TaxID=13818 RepID=A0A9D4V8Y5_ADICA|nr:hypothetical protein GOP47_0001480 [Adiantum capillus-veneris]